jgi:hypothetical protein
MKTRFALCALAIAGLADCYSYRVAPLATVEPKHQVRATPRQGRQVELFGVTVDGDTLRGTALRHSFLRDRREKVAIAVADLANVQVRRFDVRRSVVAGVVAAVAVGFTAWIVTTMDLKLLDFGNWSPGDGW